MQDKGGPEGFPICRKAGYGQDQHSDTSGNQQHVYPGPPCREQESHQYAPENPGDDQCDCQGGTHLISAQLLSISLYAKKKRCWRDYRDYYSTTSPGSSIFNPSGTFSGSTVYLVSRHQHPVASRNDCNSVTMDYWNPARCETTHHIAGTCWKPSKAWRCHRQLQQR